MVMNTDELIPQRMVQYTNAELRYIRKGYRAMLRRNRGRCDATGLFLMDVARYGIRCCNYEFQQRAKVAQR